MIMLLYIPCVCVGGSIHKVLHTGKVLGKNVDLSKLLGGLYHGATYNHDFEPLNVVRFLLDSSIKISRVLKP